MGDVLGSCVVINEETISLEGRGEEGREECKKINICERPPSNHVHPGSSSRFCGMCVCIPLSCESYIMSSFDSNVRISPRRHLP